MHGFPVRLFSLLPHIGVRLQSSSFFQPPSSLRSQVCGSHTRRQQRALGCQQQRHVTLQRGSTAPQCLATKGDPLPRIWLAPSGNDRAVRTTDTHAWLARLKAGRRPWPCGDQRRSSRTAGLQQKKKKPNSPASHSFQLEVKNATR